MSKSKCCGLLVVFLGLSLFLLTGCGSSRGRVAVRGTVTLNGQPVEDGSIVFRPLSPDDPTQLKAGGHIQQGKFTLTAERGPTTGKYLVEIRWPKKTGKLIPLKDDPPNVTDETKEAIPAKYNSNTELTADIHGGSNPLDFDLKTE